MKKVCLILVSVVLLTEFTALGQEKEKKIAQLFNGADGCFVISKVDNREHYYFNKDQCKEQFSPCSTFKIVNSLIALETGVASNTELVIKWDSIRDPLANELKDVDPFKYWIQDQSMKTAIKYSVVWYYKEIARRIGEKQMTNAINDLNYGNKNISGGIDRFWLCSSLKISAIEQTHFLRRFYNERLHGFTAKNIKEVKDIILYEETESYKLYGKTGGGKCSADYVIGWYVGFVETEKGPYVFAMNMKADDFKAFNQNRRIEITKEILHILGYI